MRITQLCIIISIIFTTRCAVFLHENIYLEGLTLAYSILFSRTVASNTCLCYTSNHHPLIPTCDCCLEQQELNAPNDIECTSRGLVCLRPVPSRVLTEPVSMYSATVPRKSLTAALSAIVVKAHITHRPYAVGENGKGGIG
jgi:hypothetical protein